MSDLIDRQAAIEALKVLPTWWADEGGYYGGAQPPMEALLYPEDAISALENLPSAQPEQKKGKWDFMGWQMFQCSECKHTFTQEFLEGWSEYTYESLFPPFCPNCGAKMER